jgi:hypothetical protein
MESGENDSGSSTSPSGPGVGGYDLVCLSGRGDKDMDEATLKLAELDG